MAQEARSRAELEDRHGVSFEAWAFVLAGLGDGLSEEALLAHLGIEEERWQLANAAFHEALLDDVEAGGTLTEAFDEAMRTARKSWSRAIPPLDVDLRAWFDFYRAWASAEFPLGFLADHGLGVADVHRLQGHWTGRLASDGALRKEALEILAAPAGPVQGPTPGPVRLRDVVCAEDDGAVTRPANARRAAVATLPFSEGEPRPPRPRLSVPLPRSNKAKRRAGADETRVAARGEIAASVLPFLEALPDVREPAPSVPETAAPHDDGERAALSIERYAALCVDLIDAPDAHEAVLRRYGISAADKLGLDVYWTQKMAEDTTIWLAWERACVERRAGDPDGCERGSE